MIEWRGSQWIVTAAQWAGGGTGHGPHDVYPDGWQLKLQKMKSDKYDPEGEMVVRYEEGTGCFMRTAHLLDYTFLRTMKRSYR